MDQMYFFSKDEDVFHKPSSFPQITHKFVKGWVMNKIQIGNQALDKIIYISTKCFTSVQPQDILRLRG